MMQKSRIKVTIDGIEYTIAGRESEEYLKQLASYVDRKLKQTKVQCDSLNNSIIAVLTAVNIADEYFKEKKINNALERQIDEFNLFKNRLNKNQGKSVKPLNINL